MIPSPSTIKSLDHILNGKIFVNPLNFCIKEYNICTCGIRRGQKVTIIFLKKKHFMSISKLFLASAVMIPLGGLISEVGAGILS